MARGPQQLSLFDGLVGLLRGSRPASPPARPAAEPAPEAEPEFLHPRANRTAELCGRTVGYELRHSRRRSIGLAVGPEGLTVTAPRRAGQGDVDRVLREKAHWVLDKLQGQRERSARMQALRMDWRAGGEVLFLGRPLALALDASVTGVQLDAGHVPPRLVVGLPAGAEASQVRDFVQGWLQRQARRIFAERCAVYGERLGVAPRRIALTSATTRWGSATADGVVRLHWRLVQFEMPIVDYVVAHELAHLREMNHSARFWQVVASAMPDYAARRRQLKEAVLPLWE